MPQLTCSLLILAAMAVPSSLFAQVVVLRAARLIDGTGAQPVRPGIVIVEDNRIRAVGTDADIPSGARVIDLGDATLLPGLIDLHTHLTDSEHAHWEEVLLTTTPAQAALYGARNARVTVMAGFTTVRDMGPTWPYVDVDLRNAIDAGLIPGPRMLVAGNYVSATGGAGDARQFSIYVDVPTVQNLADGPNEIRKVVRTNLKHGADFTKILATGAVLSRGISPGAQQYSDEELRTAVIETARWGRRVAAHAHGAEGIKAAIRAGVWTVDHGSYLDDEAIQLLRESGSTYYVPTLSTSAFILESGAERGTPQSEIERSRAIRSIKEEGFRRALAAGIPIGYATDAAVIPHGLNAREFSVRVALGEAPLQAITSATGLNAEILGWSDRLGTLEAGKLADVIAVPGDPVEDISVMEQVSFVMKDRVVLRSPGR